MLPASETLIRLAAESRLIFGSSMRGARKPLAMTAWRIVLTSWPSAACEKWAFGCSFRRGRTVEGSKPLIWMSNVPTVVGGPGVTVKGMAARGGVEAFVLEADWPAGRGRAGVDVEGDGGARARRVELAGVGDFGAVEAAVAQVGGEGVGVLAQQLLAQALPGRGE